LRDLERIEYVSRTS